MFFILYPSAFLLSPPATNCMLIAAYNKYSLGLNARPHSHHPVRQTHPPTPPGPRPVPGKTRRTNRIPPHLHRHDRTRRTEYLLLDISELEENTNQANRQPLQLLSGYSSCLTSNNFSLPIRLQVYRLNLHPADFSPSVAHGRRGRRKFSRSA